MEFFLLLKFVLFVSFLPSPLAIKKGDKKQVIVYHPKPHQNSAVVVYGNEGSGQDEAGKEQMNALANNVETVTNLVKVQSEIIQNLGHQVSSVVQDTGNDKELKKAFGKIANNTQKIQNITDKQNQTVKQVDELAGVWSATRLDLNKRLNHLQEEATENEEDIEEMEKDIVQKIEKLQEEVKALRLALKNSAEKNTANREEWPSGKYCILANGSCPSGFKRHKGHLKSLYLYSSHSQFVSESKFGSSSIGCYGSYCGQYGNFIGSITIAACCK